MVLFFLESNSVDLNVIPIVLQSSVLADEIPEVRENVI